MRELPETLESVQAERDGLARQVEILSAMVEKDGPRILELSRTGVLTVQHWSVLVMAESFAESLADAPNFLVVELTHPKQGKLVVTIRRGNGKTPDEMCVQLRNDLDRERRGTASQLRDIATRIGPAASPNWVRGKLDALANQLEVWANG